MHMTFSKCQINFTEFQLFGNGKSLDFCTLCPVLLPFINAPRRLRHFHRLKTYDFVELYKLKCWHGHYLSKKFLQINIQLNFTLIFLNPLLLGLLLVAIVRKPARATGAKFLAVIANIFSVKSTLSYKMATDFHSCIKGIRRKTLKNR